jgi:hypothetical protein
MTFPLALIAARIGASAASGPNYCQRRTLPIAWLSCTSLRETIAFLAI